MNTVRSAVPSVAGERITPVSFGMLIQSPLMRQLKFFLNYLFLFFPNFTGRESNHFEAEWKLDSA